MEIMGYVNQQEVKALVGMKGGVNPIASKGVRRQAYSRELEVHQIQQFVRRYRWKGLPKGLDPTLMERILYYRGQVVIFQLDGTFYATPFALNGSIDLYGRYMTVTPLTFNGSIMTDSEGNKRNGDGVFIQGMDLPICYDEENIEDKLGVILYDYTPGIASHIIPRFQLNITHIGDLADIITLIKYNLINSAIARGVRVSDEGQRESVEAEFANIEAEILDNNKQVFAVTAPTAIEDILKAQTLNTQAYWECFVSLDNLRENLMGIENTGIFKKKERDLKMNVEMEAGNAHLVYQDGLYQRQRTCEIMNAMFGTYAWCEESEVIAGEDSDKDGNIDDEEGAKEGNVND